MKRAVDPIFSKNFVVEGPQYSISPLATVNPTPSGSTRLNVTEKLQNKSKTILKNKETVSIGTSQKPDSDKKILKLKKRSYTRKKRPEETATNLPASGSSFASSKPVGPDFETSQTCTRYLLSSLVKKNSLRISKNPSTNICSRHIGSEKNEKPNLPKAIRIELNTPNSLGNAGYRRINFGNHHVISSDTIIINDDDEFDIFKAPRLKCLPEDIFEPVAIKKEHGLEDTIFNEDVLINSNSTSVATLTQYSDLQIQHLEEDKTDARLYHPKVGLLKDEEHREGKTYLDDRVETLRVINATSDCEVGEKNGSEVMEAQNPVANGTTTNVRDKEAAAQKTLLDNLNIQIQLLEDIVYGSDRKIEHKEEENHLINASEAETNTNTDLEDESDMDKPATDVNDATTESEDTTIEPPTESDAQENLEILGKEVKAEEMIEVSCDDPFANTFGTPDEVIIISDAIDSTEHNVDTANGKTDGGFISQPLASSVGRVDYVSCDHPPEVTKSKENNASVETSYEDKIRDHIHQIISDDKTDELPAEEACSETNCGGMVQQIETKMKIQKLQRIISYFADIINENVSVSDQDTTGSGFVRKLVDSTMKLYTFRRKHGVIRTKSRKTKSLHSQKLRKLLSKSLHRFNDISRGNDAGKEEIALSSDDTSLSTLKQLIKEANASELLLQNHFSAKSAKGHGDDIAVDDGDNNNTTYDNQNEISSQSTDISNVGKEDLPACHMKPVLFFDIEEIVDEPLEMTDKDTASTPTETELRCEEPQSRVRIGESLKTYSRKGSNSLPKELDEYCKSKSVLANLENIPDLKANPALPILMDAKFTIEVAKSTESETDQSRNGSADIPMKTRNPPGRPKKGKKKGTDRDDSADVLLETKNLTNVASSYRRAKKVQNMEEVMNRRTSGRIKKRTNFYGCECQIENKIPK